MYSQAKKKRKNEAFQRIKKNGLNWDTCDMFENFCVPHNFFFMRASSNMSVVRAQKCTAYRKH